MKSSLLTAASATVLALSLAPLAAQAQTKTSAVEEVVVTGSRVITNGNNAPTPVTVISPDQLSTTKPTNVFENLADLPMFSGSFGVTNAPSNNTPDRQTAVSALNLRNLGGLRALALFDGHRVPPTTALGFVDINTLPQMLLQRVDVVTGGASAVYGSDAVTGVVNFVIDRKFDGVKLSAQTGISEYGDAATYDVGIAAGRKIFNDRGHIEFSFQHRNDEGIPHQRDRDWTKPRWTLQGNGTAANPYHLQDGVNIAFVTFGGMIVCPTSGFVQTACPASPLVGMTFDENGVLSPFEKGSTAGLTDTTVQIGGDGAYQTWPSIKSKSKNDQFYGRFDYDLTDDIHGYVSLSGARNFTSGNPTNLRFFGQGVKIGACNAFLAQQYQTTLGCTPANAAAPPTFTFNKVWNYELNQFAPGAMMDNTVKTAFLLTGLEGKFGDGYKWDVAYTHSESTLRTRINKNQNLQHTYAALDAVTDPSSGQVVCRVALTNPGLYPGCVPINLFGPSAESAAAFDYMFTPVQYTTKFKLDSVSGAISGSPISTWAGPIDMALSGELRKQTYSLNSGSTPTMVQDCVGLRFGNCTPGVTVINLNTVASRAPVDQTAKEAAFEANIPILKDMPFFQEVNLNTAVRYTRYDNDPGSDPLLTSRTIDAITWKLGATWDINDQITLRTARSRDIRAPNLYDLYNPVAITPNSFTTDYLLTGNPQRNVPIQTGGNPFLTPEVAHTTTLGVVWRPMANLSFAVDYYNIKIRDALATISGGAEAIQRACYASNGTSNLCSLQERPLGFANTTAANALTKIYTRQVNIAEQKSHGVDFEANYRREVFDRPLSLRALVTYQPELSYSQPPINTNDQAGVAYNAAYGLLPAPVWKATVFLHYEPIKNLSVDISERYRSSLKWTADPTQYGVGGVKSVFYTNLNVSYAFKTTMGDYVAFANIQNLFDKDPPASGTPGIQNQPGYPTNGYVVGDDVVGRYYTVGVRVRF